MKKIHYGWVIVGVGVLVKMTGLGVRPVCLSHAPSQYERISRF